MSIFQELAQLLRYPLRRGAEPGFREAQITAVHSIVAHRWARQGPALVVMPTGSGKTAVIIAACIALRAKRVLVVVPSQLLREQIVEKFKTLELLKSIGAIDEDAPSPAVVEVTTVCNSVKKWESFHKADVVVGTPNVLSPAMGDVVAPPQDLFDIVVFDEAHHTPAPIYQTLAKSIPAARHLLFTATPYRRDRKDVRADLVFMYELGRARRDGVYGRLEFVPVEPAPGENADVAIARAVAVQHAADAKAGRAHRVLVRAASRKRADDLAKLYKQHTKLRLRRMHSGLRAGTIRTALRQLVEGKLDGVIAVDMLGEGFDLPNLKIAALHSPHKSLAITLQFIGRFARTTPTKELGDARFFAVPDEVRGEAESLYAPGAEWNELVETLSGERLAVETERREVLSGFTSDVGESVREQDEEERIEEVIWATRPFIHAKVYEVTGPVDLDVQIPLPNGTREWFTRRNESKHVLLCVAEQTRPPRWNKALLESRYEMIVIAHLPVQRFVFICTSQHDNASYDRLIQAVAGTRYRRLSPDEVNRVLNGLAEQKLFSMGMRSRAAGAGGETYRTSNGPSSDKALTAADTGRFEQGHAVCGGVEDGVSTVVGFSSASKIWSNRNVSLAQLLRWFEAAALKLRDDQPVAVRTMFDRLGKAKRIEKLPSKVVDAGLPVEAYNRPAAAIQTNKGTCGLLDFSVELGDQSGTTVDLAFRGRGLVLRVRYNSKAPPHFAGSDSLTRKASLVDPERDDMSFIDFLNEHPVELFLQDLSRVSGQNYSPRPDGDVSAIMTQIEAVDWDAYGTNPHVEKPLDENDTTSIFHFVERRLRAQQANVVVMDDGAGEIADYIAVTSGTERTLVELFHCKAASRGRLPYAVPNAKVDDLYEVLGQAVKCGRWLDAEALVAQVRHRVTNTSSRFIAGTIETMSALLRESHRVQYSVVVVQPGLSTEPKPVIADLLAAADAYRQTADRLPLRFLGTQARAAAR